MGLRLAACCVSVCLCVPATGWAQETGTPHPSIAPTPSVPTAPNTSFKSLPRFDGSAAGKQTPDGFWSPFKAVPGDFNRFFTQNTMKFVGFGALGALFVHQWDEDGIEGARELRPSMFHAGNISGGFLVQTGTALGLYSISRAAGADRLAQVGGDLIRAQILSQGIVQAGKMATRRTRPDSSNNHSLPSGHTASAFATASVLHDHFGWKVGVPAYTFGAYVAASRMSANKHHLSDVVLGAAIGLAAGRTVTLGSGRARFDMNVAPTIGGAAITFSKR